MALSYETRTTMRQPRDWGDTPELLPPCRNLLPLPSTHLELAVYSQPAQRAIVQGYPRRWANPRFHFLTLGCCMSCTQHHSGNWYSSSPPSTAALKQTMGLMVCNPPACRQVKGALWIYRTGTKYLKATVNIRWVASPAPKELTRAHW